MASLSERTATRIEVCLCHLTVFVLLRPTLSGSPPLVFSPPSKSNLLLIDTKFIRSSLREGLYIYLIRKGIMCVVSTYPNRTTTDASSTVGPGVMLARPIAYLAIA